MPEDRFLIRVYGDSLTCPRISSDISYYDIYQELLADEYRHEWPHKLVHLTTRSRPDAPITELYEESYLRDSVYFGKMSTDVLIIHCGICDCAPRPIPRWVRNLIGKSPGKIKRRIIWLLHNYRARILKAGYLWRLTKPEAFRETYYDWMKKAVQEARLVYAINILPTIPSIESHSPGLGSSIVLFNQIISDVVKSIDAKNLFLVDVHKEILSRPNGVETFVDQGDGHHLTFDGHVLLHQLLSNLTMTHLREVQP